MPPPKKSASAASSTTSTSRSSPSSSAWRAAGIKAGDLDYVVFFEKPFRKFDRILMSVLQTYPQSYKVFRESMITWMIDKLWVGIEDLGGAGHSDRARSCSAEHHMSHAASAFLCSPFEEAAILTVDGVGEWVTGTLGRRQGQPDRYLRKQMMFPHSLGLLYSAFTAFLGFEVNEGEYKVMGMAPYGQPRYVDKVWKLIRQEADGSFSLDMDYFCFQHSTTRTFNKKFVQLFGEPRPPKMLFFTADSGFPTYFGEAPSNFNELCKMNQHYADIAASIQQVTEEVLIGMARQLHKETGMSKLCIAGGVGLNSVANHRILRETPFEEIFIQPAAGDGGGALGAALWADNMLLGNSGASAWTMPTGARRTPMARRSSSCSENGIPYQRIEDDDKLLDLAVDRLQQGKVIGWYQGRFEWGPRALGNRSIIADAAQSQHEGHRQHQDQVPRALSAVRAVGAGGARGGVLRAAERDGALSGALHALRGAGAAIEAQRAAGHHPRRRHGPPADGVRRCQPALLRADRALRAGDRRAGVLNTSFNLKGEPIVTTPANAFSTFFAQRDGHAVPGQLRGGERTAAAEQTVVQAEPVAAK